MWTLSSSVGVKRRHHSRAIISYAIREKAGQQEQMPWYGYTLAVSDQNYSSAVFIAHHHIIAHQQMCIVGLRS